MHFTGIKCDSSFRIRSRTKDILTNGQNPISNRSILILSIFDESILSLFRFCLCFAFVDVSILLMFRICQCFDLVDMSIFRYFNVSILPILSILSNVLDFCQLSASMSLATYDLRAFVHYSRRIAVIASHRNFKQSFRSLLASSWFQNAFTFHRHLLEEVSHNVIQSGTTSSTNHCIWNGNKISKILRRRQLTDNDTQYQHFCPKNRSTNLKY